MSGVLVRRIFDTIVDQKKILFLDTKIKPIGYRKCLFYKQIYTCRTIACWTINLVVSNHFFHTCFYLKSNQNHKNWLWFWEQPENKTFCQVVKKAVTRWSLACVFGCITTVMVISLCFTNLILMHSLGNNVRVYLIGCLKFKNHWR